MALRRFVVFTVFVLMLAAAPVWAITGTIPDLPRINDPVKIDGNTLDSKEGPNIFDAQLHDLRATWQFSVRSFIRLTATDRTFFLKIGYAWTP